MGVTTTRRTAPNGDGAAAAARVGGDDLVPSAFTRAVGARLRQIRRQKGLSLQEVEGASALEFKASVLGAYERGERAISVPRLQRLAGIYEVPVDQLLPDGAPTTTTDDLPRRSVTLDLRAVQQLPGVEGELLRRLLGMIQVQRQDFNGRVLTVRDDDLRAIACILGVRPEYATRRLEELDLRVVR